MSNVIMYMVMHDKRQILAYQNLDSAVIPVQFIVQLNTIFWIKSNGSIWHLYRISLFVVIDCIRLSLWQMTEWQAQMTNTARKRVPTILIDKKLHDVINWNSSFHSRRIYHFTWKRLLIMCIDYDPLVTEHPV